MIKRSLFDNFKVYLAGTGLCFASILLFSGAASAQSEEDLRWANDVFMKANTGSRTEKLAAVSTILDRFRANSKSGISEREFIQFLEFQKSYLAFDPNGLSKKFGSAVSAATPQARRSFLMEARYDLLQQFDAASRNLSPDNITAQDAKNLLAALTTASAALDDIRNPSMLNGKASAITSILSRAGGLLDFAATIRDPEAKSIVSGLNSILGSMKGKIRNMGASVPNPMKAFDWPLAVSAAQLQVTRDAFIKTTAAMDDVAKAMDGNAEALNRLPAHAKNVGDSLSPQRFGSTMAAAAADRLLGNIPVIRNLIKWIKPALRVPAIVKFLNLQIKCGTADKPWGKFEVIQNVEFLKIVSTESHPPCYGSGDVLLEGEFIEGDRFEVTIYQIWDDEPTRIHRGALYVQNSGFLRMEAASMSEFEPNGKKWLFK